MTLPTTSVYELLRPPPDGEGTALTKDQVDGLRAFFEYQQDRIAALSATALPRKDSPPTPPSICLEADQLVSHDRLLQYGHPKDDFSRTAAMWEPLLGLPPGHISPEKVGLCMIALKMSRLCHAYKRDTAVDIAGYAKTISLICEDS